MSKITDSEKAAMNERAHEIVMGFIVSAGVIGFVVNLAHAFGG